MKRKEIKLLKNCPAPFEELEITSSGEVYTCCQNWNNAYSFGNIYKLGAEEIWNSDKAVELRSRILNGDYSLCNKEVCPYLKQNHFESYYRTEYKAIMDEHPKSIKFCYDYECNIACNICRDKIRRLSDEELELLNSKIDSFFLPLLKSAKVLVINAHGDPFGSRHSRLVIKKAAEMYPDLKFDFHTNGILCNEKNFKALNITPEKIAKIRISTHAASAKTYGKIVKNGAILFPQLIKNFEYLSKISREYNIPMYLHMVIMPCNYKEIPAFIKLAQKHNFSPRFWEYRSENCVYQHPEDDWFIYKKEHKDHKKLAKVLENNIVIRNREFFSPVFYDIIPEKEKKFFGFFD